MIKILKQKIAVGWTREGAVQVQIEANVRDADKLAKSRLPEGESFWESC